MKITRIKDMEDATLHPNKSGEDRLFEPRWKRYIFVHDKST